LEEWIGSVNRARCVKALGDAGEIYRWFQRARGFDDFL
jgi:hypothetical protein